MFYNNASYKDVQFLLVKMCLCPTAKTKIKNKELNKNLKIKN